MINMAMVSLKRMEANITANKTSKLPKLEAITRLHSDKRIILKDAPKTEAPIKTSATPRLAPLLSPKT